VRIDQKTGKIIQEAEIIVYTRTGTGNTRLRFKKMRMKVDVSDYVMGGMLSIEYKDGR